MKTLAIVLAAKQGNQMKSYVNRQEKASFNVLDKAIVTYMIDVLQQVVKKTYCIVSNNSTIKDIVGSTCQYIVQEKTNGTFNALRLCKKHYDNFDNIICLYGCMPLITSELITSLLKHHQENNNDLTYVEGIYLFRSKVLLNYLEKIEDVASIIDVLGLMKKDGNRMEEFNSFKEDCLVIKNRIDLEKAQQIMKKRINSKHMLNGISIVDSNNTYIGADVKIGNDTIIYPNTYIYGKSIIGVGSELGPNTYIIDSFIDNGAVLKNCSICNKTIKNEK